MESSPPMMRGPEAPAVLGGEDRGHGDCPTIAEVLGDPGVRRWVKDAITTLLQRDCVDAAQDAELVAALMVRRCQEMLGSKSLGASDADKLQEEPGSPLGPLEVPRILQLLISCA